uniref:Uncharacterized protein n=1 Tax=Trichuris muris TaxID=70415 RepID=A0A5S6QZR5_TRIMR
MDCASMADLSPVILFRSGANKCDELCLLSGVLAAERQCILAMILVEIGFSAKHHFSFNFAVTVNEACRFIEQLFSSNSTSTVRKDNTGVSLSFQNCMRTAIV